MARALSEKSYVLKITLDGAEPEISRRFVVPSDIPLDHLHDVIQTVMGWQDYHLHEFQIDGRRFTEHFDEILDDYDGESEEDGMFHLDDLVKVKGTEFKYIYDFGDGWEHTLVFEKTKRSFAINDEPVMCISGKGACPPEDVGGIGGYFRFCQIMDDPTDEEHEDFKYWYGKPFKPQAFDRDNVNMQLLKYMRLARARFISWDPCDGKVDKREEFALLRGLMDSLSSR